MAARRRAARPAPRAAFGGEGADLLLGAARARRVRPSILAMAEAPPMPPGGPPRAAAPIRLETSGVFV
jgi:hypothetical protein